MRGSLHAHACGCVFTERKELTDVLIFCLFVFQRRTVVTGAVEPTDEECEWHSDREEDEDLTVRICIIIDDLLA